MTIKWDNAPPSVCDMWADTVRAPLQQRWMYGAVCTALGRRVRRASIPNDNGDDSVCQFISRRAFGTEFTLGLRANLPSDTTNIAQRLRRDLPARTILGISPETGPVGDGFHRVVSAQTSAILDIAPETQNIRTGLHQKWRNRLVFAENKRLDIRHVACDRKTLLSLLDTETKQQRQRRYRAIPAVFTGAWHEIAPETVRLFSARRNGNVISTMLFLRHGNTATYHIGWSDEIGRQSSAHHALMWRAVCDLRDAGVASIDLGLINTRDAAGLARFKLGTGAQAVTTGSTFVALPPVISLARRLPIGRVQLPQFLRDKG